MNYLQNEYEINPKTGNYIIKVTVKNYKDLFNDLDSAPLRKRDMNTEIRDFLYECFTDIPYKSGIELNIRISEEAKCEKSEDQIILGLRNYYYFCLHADVKHLNRVYLRITKYAITSFLFLYIGFFLENKLRKSIFSNTLLEGLNIGGWIFLWESISTLLYKQKKIRYRIKSFKRFLNSKILFRYGRDV